MLCIHIRDISEGDNYLVFYQVHHYVEIYLDGQLVYSLMPKNDNPVHLDITLKDLNGSNDIWDGEEYYVVEKLTAKELILHRRMPLCLSFPVLRYAFM